ncbi:MAG: DUF2520 domain-containing protein [Eudoraea sp.]|nr:DUF2520 domain-containing protein [Eudoraea sp.]NNJ41589.1 DUF2520 domain-containing protein [Eudoraea sp.]
MNRIVNNSKRAGAIKIVFLVMHKVVLLGTGNLAHHLFDAFTKSNSVSVVQVFGRSAERLAYFKDRTKVTHKPENLLHADIYIIAVSDDAIHTVSQYIKNKKSIIAHCSGGMGLETLTEGSDRGVFYPLQSFSKGRKIDFSEVPLCIEGSSEIVLEKLISLGRTISQICVPINSKQRLAMHLAAVYTNNFTNHLLFKASQICEENDLPFSLLMPLLKETVSKLGILSPYDAQTGPARRNDRKTQEKHMKIISNKQDREIYALLSEAIQTTYGD